MPYFAAFPVDYTAKPGVVSDGELITVASDGYTVTSTLSNYTAFHSNPVRSATGVWSATMKDSAFKVINVNVQTVLASTHYLSTQLLPTTTSNGKLVLNWVFNNAGTPTDLPSTGSFQVYVVYAETSF